eukprot:624552-Prorocentrum_minimum.AAC.1
MNSQTSPASARWCARCTYLTISEATDRRRCRRDASSTTAFGSTSATSAPSSAADQSDAQSV